MVYPPEEYSDDEWEEVFDNPDASHYCLSPCCYICGYKFTIEVDDLKFDLESARAQRRYKAGLCKAHELEDLDCFRRKAWWTIFRMILCNQKSHALHISGVAHNWCYPEPNRVPLDEGRGMLYRPMTNGQEKHVVIPKFRDPLKEPRPHWEWVGYHVHARCWELLLYHELGAFTERNLSTVLAALRQSYMKRRRQSKIESPKMSLEDPVRTKCVSDAIGVALEQAERRKFKGKHANQELQQIRSCNLPVEIFYIIFNYVPSQTVADVEKALGLFFGNTFWRSRISSKFFHEKEDVAKEDLDWKRLCLKLERQLEKSDALATRRYLFNCLDDVLDIMKTSTGN